MAFSYPGGLNTPIPSLELSGNLMVSFSRNPTKFAVNKIAQIQPVKQWRGLYAYFNPADLARFPSGNTKQNLWANGTPSPTGFTTQQGFEYREFTCLRYAFASSLENTAINQAPWPVVKTHTELLAQKAMSNRALLVANLLTTSANHLSTHVSTATALGGGFLSTGSITNPVILNTLNAAAQVIQLDTRGLMTYQNLSVVMNPNTARKLSQSSEIHTFLAQSQFAMDQIRGNKPGQNARFGLPDQLYAYNVIVEDAVYDSANVLATSDTPAYVFPDNKIVLVMREEDMEASEGAHSFSAVHLMVNEDLLVEDKDDEWNRMTHLRVVDTIVPQFVAPVSAYLITNVFS